MANWIFNDFTEAGTINFDCTPESYSTSRSVGFTYHFGTHFFEIDDVQFLQGGSPAPISGSWTSGGYKYTQTYTTLRLELTFASSRSKIVYNFLNPSKCYTDQLRHNTKDKCTYTIVFQVKQTKSHTVVVEGKTVEQIDEIKMLPSALYSKSGSLVFIRPSAYNESLFPEFNYQYNSQVYENTNNQMNPSHSLINYNASKSVIECEDITKRKTSKYQHDCWNQIVAHHWKMAYKLGLGPTKANYDAATMFGESSSVGLKPGQSILVKSTAKRFTTGEEMAKWIPGSKFIVVQVNSNNNTVCITTQVEYERNPKNPICTGWISISDIEGAPGTASSYALTAKRFNTLLDLLKYQNYAWAVDPSVRGYSGQLKMTGISENAIFASHVYCIHLKDIVDKYHLMIEQKYENTYNDYTQTSEETKPSKPGSDDDGDEPDTPPIPYVPDDPDNPLPPQAKLIQSAMPYIRVVLRWGPLALSTRQAIIGSVNYLYNSPTSSLAHLIGANQGNISTNIVYDIEIENTLSNLVKWTYGPLLTVSYNYYCGDTALASLIYRSSHAMLTNTIFTLSQYSVFELDRYNLASLIGSAQFWLKDVGMLSVKAPKTLGSELYATLELVRNPKLRVNSVVYLDSSVLCWYVNSLSGNYKTVYNWGIKIVDLIRSRFYTAAVIGLDISNFAFLVDSGLYGAAEAKTLVVYKEYLQWNHEFSSNLFINTYLVRYLQWTNKIFSWMNGRACKLESFASSGNLFTNSWLYGVGSLEAYQGITCIVRYAASYLFNISLERQTCKPATLHLLNQYSYNISYDLLSIRNVSIGLRNSYLLNLQTVIATIRVLQADYLNYCYFFATSVNSVSIKNVSLDKLILYTFRSNNNILATCANSIHSYFLYHFITIQTNAVSSYTQVNLVPNWLLVLKMIGLNINQMDIGYSQEYLFRTITFPANIQRVTSFSKINNFTCAIGTINDVLPTSWIHNLGTSRLWALINKQTLTYVSSAFGNKFIIDVGGIIRSDAIQILIFAPIIQLFNGHLIKQQGQKNQSQLAVKLHIYRMELTVMIGWLYPEYISSTDLMIYQVYDYQQTNSRLYLY